MSRRSARCPSMSLRPPASNAGFSVSAAQHRRRRRRRGLELRGNARRKIHPARHARSSSLAGHRVELVLPGTAVSPRAIPLIGTFVRSCPRIRQVREKSTCGNADSRQPPAAWSVAARSPHPGRTRTPLRRLPEQMRLVIAGHNRTGRRRTAGNVAGSVRASSRGSARAPARSVTNHGRLHRQSQRQRPRGNTRPLREQQRAPLLGAGNPRAGGGVHWLDKVMWPWPLAKTPELSIR